MSTRPVSLCLSRRVCRIRTNEAQREPRMTMNLLRFGMRLSVWIVCLWHSVHRFEERNFVLEHKKQTLATFCHVRRLQRPGGIADGSRTFPSIAMLVVCGERMMTRPLPATR
ncbi:hypothetical protein BV25DRAFT_1038489 [Artomyces pyxidatus]|uniref:Uncharacterized protein n=1 Tax=Artomyces pyxidatus TaxID=48021 RepID=A0ACB8SUM5_9AGAM|nr:hypothetical protein BV25DRAFT_1038489 [Artomyces pyxidatus]